MRASLQALGLVLFLVLTRPITGQTHGEITGALTDTTGGVLVGAQITVRNTATNQVRQVVTNATGNYSVPFLVPAIYDVQAERPGFKLATRSGVDLQVGAVVRIDFALEVGEISQRVEVSGGASMLTTESATLGTVIENKRIVELPLNGRNYLQLVALSPNVVAESGSNQSASLQGGDRSRQSFALAGQRLEYNHYTLDGVENTDVNFNTYVLRPSIDAVQEFKVQSGIYSAEFGRSVGQINATTRSGTNEYHASVFEFLRNSALDAKEWLQQGNKNPFRRNQFGFTFGGRLIRNRLFFLSNFEALRDRKTLQQTAGVATDRMRNGDMSAQPRGIFDPQSRGFATDAQGNERAVSATPFPNNTIPRSRFHPTSLKLLEFLPPPTVPGDSILRNYIRQNARGISSDQFLQRMDWNESNRSSWFGRFGWSDEFEELTATFPYPGRVQTKVYQAVLSNTRTLGTTTVNELRFGYNQFQNDKVGYHSFLRDVTTELNIPGLKSVTAASWGFPDIGLGNGLSGNSEPNPYVTRNHTFQLMDTVSIVRGRHTLKFGAEVRRDRYNELGNSFARGSFTFSGSATFDPANRTTTGFSYGDFLLGESASSERGLNLSNTMLRASSAYFYFQDDWKITSRLTVNLGLRYENNRPWHDKYRGILNVQMFDPGVGPDGLLSGTKAPIMTRPGSGDFYQDIPFRFHDGIPVQAGDQYIGRSLVNSDNNDFAPRLGMAYSPTTRWTLRAGIGVFYAKDATQVVWDMGRNMAGRGRLDADQDRPNSNLSDPWKFQRERYQCSGYSGTCLGPPQLLTNTIGRRSPYINQWLFNIQRQLSQDIALEVGYQGSQGHKLERYRIWNQPVSRTGPNDARSPEQRRPWPAYGNFQMVDSSANANYNALSGKFTQRFSRGLTYLVGYTWSKSIDSGSAIRNNTGDNQWPADSYNLHRERALSQFHTGRRFVTSVLYELPLGAGKPFANWRGVANKLLGGWQVGSILTFVDGTPQHVGGIGDTNQTTLYEGNRPNATGISPFPAKQTVDNFWNIAAFDTTSPSLNYLFGTTGRNVLFKPGTRQWDFSMVKNTSIRERHSLQFRFEAFNFANHPNWNTPSVDPRTVSTFGKITSARTMREMQFGLKYMF
jgi:hypothetical protein